MISPILRSTSLCLKLVVQRTRDVAGNLDSVFQRIQATGRQHCGCIVPQAVNTV